MWYGINDLDDLVLVVIMVSCGTIAISLLGMALAIWFKK